MKTQEMRVQRPTPLTNEEATKFFAEFYGGEHHIPGHKLYRFGDGWIAKHYCGHGDLATYDFNSLTRLVLMAHRDCYRVCIMPLNFNTIKIAIHKRSPDGGWSTGHPTIETALEEFNNSIKHDG